MWRSLVARLTGGQEVAGSSPVIPTLQKRGPQPTRQLGQLDDVPKSVPESRGRCPRNGDGMDIPAMRKLFFRKSHSTWCVHHGGKMARLSADRDEAFQKYHELMANGRPAAPNDSVASFCNAFLA